MNKVLKKTMIAGDGTRRNFLLKSIGSFSALLLYGCSQGAGWESLVPSGPTGVVSGGGIAITPSTLTIVGSGTQTFNAAGGTGTYSWSLSNTSLASIDSTTGAFTAGTAAGTVTVIATDSSGSTGTATVTISSAAIAVSPSTVTIATGGTQTFTASGGTGSYTWAVSDTAFGSINSTTGLFTAGSTAGTVAVNATDTAGNTGTAAVTIS